MRANVAAGLVSLITLVAGCADDGSVEAGDATTASPAPAAESDAAESDAAATTSTTAVATSSTSTTAGSGDGEAATNFLVDQLFAQTGIEPSDEVIQCLTDRGIDLDALPTDEQAGQELTVALFACAPDELAASFAAEAVAPAGIEQEQVECVTAGAFRYIGELPLDDALAAINSPDIPDEHRAVLAPQLAEECDLTEEQVNAALDA